MKIYTEIIGNLQDPEWVKKAREAEIEYIDLDQWTAQKSRFVVKGDRENEYAVALKRHSQMLDGDIIEYLPEQRRIAAIRIRLNDVLVADLSDLARQTPETIIHISVELGHAIGNQHWPAVVKGTKVYIPLTVDKKSDGQRNAYAPYRRCRLLVPARFGGDSLLGAPRNPASVRRHGARQRRTPPSRTCARALNPPL